MFKKAMILVASLAAFGLAQSVGNATPRSERAGWTITSGAASAWTTSESASTTRSGKPGWKVVTSVTSQPVVRSKSSGGWSVVTGDPVIAGRGPSYNGNGWMMK